MRLGRTGYISGTLAVREGLRAPVPAVDPRPILTLDDMGHGGMGGHGGHDWATWRHLLYHRFLPNLWRQN